ncbi:hypothetical protein [Crateriforma conspicua]|uniref:hypothetical protein n=1 Tax=Crateriforma conspicua TaxID=2527996 RepID=UPI00118A82C9|nr:hypothetical protein [Crateriforma conspicua]QDV62016.1 hypothetical protein Mal65_11440 [Crateriforma conspicua]
MSAKSTDPSTPTLIEHLEQDLVAAEAKEQTAQVQVEDAKALLSAAKDESKRLRKIIGLYSGKASASLTKKTIRPIVERLLKDGSALSEDDLRDRVESELREKSIARTGLSLILRVLKKEFSSNGVWSLNTDRNAQTEGADSPLEASAMKGGAK